MSVRRTVHIVTGCGASLSAIPRDDKIACVRDHGVVVFRGFAVGSANFVAVAHELARAFLNMSISPQYREMVEPGGIVAGVLKGTHELAPHMERGYSPLKPELVMFYAIKPAPVGGECLLCHGADVLAALSQGTVELLRSKRIVYRSSWEPSAWQSRYGRTKADVAALFGARDDIPEFRFEGDVLHYSYVAPLIVESRLSPGAGFVNSLMGAWTVKQAWAAGERRQPFEPGFSFDDGEPISDELVAEIKAAIEAATLVFPIAPHDLVVIDNFRVMHGRNRFEGERTVHAIMGDANF